jgi:hypothetical protein
MKKQVFTFSTRGCLCILLLAASFLLIYGCQKKSSEDNLYGNVPRKPVPDPFVGTFVYVTSSGGYVDQVGSTTVGVAEGVTLQINADGTGTFLYRAESGSYSGTVTTDEIYAQCTYEITKIDNTQADITIHTVSGKDYHNGVYLHDLDASKIYPNNDIVWHSVPYGIDSQGRDYFVVGSGSTAAQFTKN